MTDFSNSSSVFRPSSPAEWDSCIATLPNSHLLQSWLWGDFKADYGWQPRRLLWEGATEPG